MHVSISSGNTKMGKIPSVSLPAGTTCSPGLPCWKKCYARKLENLRPTVRNAYERNYDILINEPDTYWREVEAVIMLSRYFRFHVSGDIVDTDYLARMVAVATTNPHCQILCFTKRYDIVNQYLQRGFLLPKNLHILFSVWKGLPVNNPFRLPEAHVLYRDGTTTAIGAAVHCLGNCSTCASTDGGCWGLKRGDAVLLDEH